MEFQHRLPQLFLGISGMAFISCLSRSDYNLPLFLFVWLIWHSQDKFQRVRMIFLMIATAFVDIGWILYWGSAWDSSADDSWMNALHHMVFVISILEILVKIATIGIAFLSEKENIIENLPERISRMISKE